MDKNTRVKLCYIENMTTLSRFQYGKIRVWGTVGYVVASKVCSSIYDYVFPKTMEFFFTNGLIICLFLLLPIPIRHIYQLRFKILVYQ